MSSYIGIDGGGTRARAVVVDGDGRELARYSGGAGIVDSRAPARAADVVAQLAALVLDAAGVSKPATGLCCGLAGAGRAQEREAVRAALALTGIADRVTVVGDAEAAMANAFVGSPGVLLVAGTGSIAWARGVDGEAIRVGGWGVLLGDEGSGYDIGIAALRAVARAADGRSAPTALTAEVLQAAHVAQPSDLIAWAAAGTKRDIAALAPLVLRAADDGDEAAAMIRITAVDALAAHAVAAARRAQLDEPDIALAGGLLEPGAPLHLYVRAQLHAVMPRARVLERTVDAALGAAAIARAAPPD